MIDLDKTIFIQLANFLIALIGLNYVLIKPIRAKIAERKALMSTLVSEVDSFASEADGKLKNYEAELDKARVQGVEARMKMKDEAGAEEKKLVEAAAAEAQSKLSAARATIAQESKAAFDALKAKVDGLAKDAAAKVLG